MTAATGISIIIPTWNTCGLLAACLESIKQTAPEYVAKTIVIDNASTDDTVLMLHDRFPVVQVVCNQENVGFACALNQGAALSAERYLLFLNSDAQLLPDALTALRAVVEGQDRAGVVGAQIHNPDGSLQASYARFPTLRQEFLVLSGLGRWLHGPYYPSQGAHDEQGARPVDWVSGACLLVRRTAFDAVSGFDAAYFMYAEEVDLCYRMRAAGWQTWYQPSAHVKHIGGASSVARLTAFEGDLYRSRVVFFRKHYGTRAARLLAVQIYAFTALKIIAHGALRRISRGRYGRQVIDLRSLAGHMSAPR